MMTVHLLFALKCMGKSAIYETGGNVTDSMGRDVIGIRDVFNVPWLLIKGFVQFQKDLGMCDFVSLSGSLFYKM